LRQRKKDRLRSQLIETGLRLFLERGYNAATIDQICAAIDVSPRTFFRYFETKDDLVVLGRMDVADDLREFARSAPAEQSPFAVARDAMRLIAARTGARSDAIAIAGMIARTPQLLARLATLRESWARELAAGLEPRITSQSSAFEAQVIAATAQWMMAASSVQWVAEGGRRPLPAILEEAFAHADRAYAAHLSAHVNAA
jgi:AcrR family transcriptional regulator